MAWTAKAREAAKAARKRFNALKSSKSAEVRRSVFVSRPNYSKGRKVIRVGYRLGRTVYVKDFKVR